MKQLYILLITFFITAISFGQVNVGDIIITEIMQNPSAVSDANGEYFEVYNTTASSIDMNGWTIKDLGTDSHIISSSVVVPANGYAVFAKNGDTAVNGGFTSNYTYSGITLGNSSDELLLVDAIGTTIDEVDWDNGATFPDPNGASMELSTNKYNSVDNDTGSNWSAAVTVFGSGDKGTPGTINDFTLGIVKNQIAGFAMYPNPVSNGKFVITTNNGANKQVEIYSMIGKQVYSKTVKANETIDVSNLNQGIYVLRVKEDNKIATRKLIVN
ncbi:lamin tail domain-containing protein [Lutibacter sp.]|uniref:lamin tail domain-containing protein n=1 Tax=Lutibacter sp. TaxID=1925666 RepID=UPI0025BD5B96|nr:lamin tail domain-containing protein [Lutibacter sp.]MCF6180602.1 lamin tail domain-containing protein [Lutibacter sp.]